MISKLNEFHDKLLIKDIRKDNIFKIVFFIFIGVTSIIFGVMISGQISKSEILIFLGALLLGNGVEKLVSFKLRSLLLNSRKLIDTNKET
jgi:phosphate starvation-inducible membrane PsiE